jgi:hypothetical protein
MTKKSLDISNNHVDKIKTSSLHSTKLLKSFEEISKNDGIAYIFLDPSETHPQLLHHGQVLGGNWSSPTKHMVTVLGTDSHEKPIQIIEKSKKISFNGFTTSLGDEDSFMALRNPKTEFLHKT